MDCASLKSTEEINRVIIEANTMDERNVSRIPLFIKMHLEQRIE